MLSRVGRIVGIVTPMDINSNIVGKGMDPNATLVSTIMTPVPDTVSPDTTVLQALRKASLRYTLSMYVYCTGCYTPTARGTMTKLVWYFGGLLLGVLNVP